MDINGKELETVEKNSPLVEKEEVIMLPKETLDFFKNDEIRARVFFEKYALKDEKGNTMETLIVIISAPLLPCCPIVCVVSLNMFMNETEPVDTIAELLTGAFLGLSTPMSVPTPPPKLYVLAASLHQSLVLFH